MNNNYSLIHVLKTLARWKKQIYIVTGLVALISVIGSLMMPNYYKSTAVVYAASPTLANPDPIGGLEKKSFIYGTPEDLDRIFSIANSGSVKNFIIDKFNLSEHYGIDTSTAKGKAKLAAKFNKFYETKKTKYDAILMSVEDTDPIMARDIVKAVRERVSDVSQAIVKESQYKSLESLKGGIEAQEKILKVTGDSLTRLKDRYKIYDSYSQAKAFAASTTQNEGNLAGKRAKLAALKKFGGKRDSIIQVKAEVAALEQKMLKIDTMIRSFNEGVLSVRIMEVAQVQGVEEIALERERVKKLQASYDKSFQAIHIIEKESIPNEKSRPKRSLIVIGLTMLAFVLSCLAVLLIDSTKHINWREIYAGE